ncbi:orotidine-5'-phosphate decarboxylase [bacterium]|nr:MAG: orotidine-5'-phosphate decarboxylase [bacterium]
MKLASAKNRIIFPLDFASLGEALKSVSLLKNHVGVFKIGLELFTACGPEAVKAVKEKAPGVPIFLDMKFHDIPATVKGAMKSAAGLGVEFITVHCDEGRGLLKAVAEAGAGKTKVLGVTVLTSLSGADLTEIGIDPKYKTPADLVLHRARLARLAGCAGVVCSGQEADAVREEFGRDFLIVTPGIRSATDDVGDQKRIVTPYDAIYSGADYIVVGRPIRNAKDPLIAAEEIAKEIERAIENRGG